MSSKSKKRNKPGPAPTHPWEKVGPAILRKYLQGGSPRTLSAEYGIPHGAISKFLLVNGVRRTQREAKHVERAQNRGRKHADRVCFSCQDLYTPRSPTQKHCRACIPDRVALSRFSSKNITQRDWDRMMAAQGGLCALCQRPATVVDHSHETLIVRGLLCVGCNLALSRIEELGWGERATIYLTRDTGHRVRPEAHAVWERSMENVRVKRLALRA